VEPLTDFVLDTVALVRYLEDRLPRGAQAAFRSAEAGRSTLYLPQIALAEFVYIALKGKVDEALTNASIQETVQLILGSSFISLEEFPERGWEILLNLRIPEPHDRLIAAEALARDLAVVSNDSSFDDISGLTVVWD
jgi:predicted nucleic acid-binding protein